MTWTARSPGSGKLPVRSPEMWVPLKHGPGWVTPRKAPFLRTAASGALRALGVGAQVDVCASPLTPADQVVPTLGGLLGQPGVDRKSGARPTWLRLSHSGQGPMCGLSPAPGGVLRTASCRSLLPGAGGGGWGQALAGNVCKAGWQQWHPCVGSKLENCLGRCIFREASPEVQNVSQTGDTVFCPGCPRLLGSVLCQTGTSQLSRHAVWWLPLRWQAA